MKTKPIQIEPGSGTKLAGKKIFQDRWAPSNAVTILFVGDHRIFTIYNNHETSWPIDWDWCEVIEEDTKLEASIYMGEYSTCSPARIVIKTDDGKEIKGELWYEVPKG